MVLEENFNVVINESVLQWLKTNGLTFEHYVLMYCMYKHVYSTVATRVRPSEDIYSDLRVMGILRKKQNLLSKEGIETLSELLNDTNINVEFERFWKAIPASDKWGNHPLTRMDFKTEKPQVRLAFIKASEMFPADDLIQAHALEVEARKESSIKINNLKYMKKPLNWFKQGHYLAALDLLAAQGTKTTSNTEDYGKNVI